MSGFFILDSETLGLRDESVLLSLAICFVDLDFAIKSTPTELYNFVLDNSKFIKFDLMEQKNEYNRWVSKDTLEWWSKIDKDIQQMSLIPSDKDLSAKDGLNDLGDYIKSINGGYNYPIYQRGYLDGSIIVGLSESVGVKCPMNPFRFRDVRTIIDVLYGSTDGYCDVDGFDKSIVKKHDPIHDIAKDAIMIIHGKHKDDTDDKYSKGNWGS